MKIVNMLKAKTSLSRLIKTLEKGTEREIIITRNGKPAAKLVAVPVHCASKRLGVAKGLFSVPNNIDLSNEKVAKLFQGH